jgi:hypothetical protein
MMFLFVTPAANRYQPPRRVFVMIIAVMRPAANLADASAAAFGLGDGGFVSGVALWGHDSSLC